VRGEHQSARVFAEEALRLAEQINDALLVALGNWHLGFILFALGDYLTAHTHLQRVIAFYKPQEHHYPFVFLRGSDAGVSALAYDACCLWCLGYPEQAVKRSHQALALARELDHAFSLADVLCFGGCVFNQMRRDVPALKDNAGDLMRLSNRMDFLSFGGTGTCYWGDALAKQGFIEEGIAQLHLGMKARESVGARCYLTGILGALAEAQAQAGKPGDGLATLAEAIALVEEFNEQYYAAELYRLQGALLLRQGNEDRAEASLQEAVEISKRQSARSWELRAVTSLARLWQKQGRLDEARAMLAEVYGWFTEGFDAPDLLAAHILLEGLSNP
jgi:predicted ATPase